MNFTQAVSRIQYRVGGLLRKTTPALLALAGWCALLAVASHGSIAYAQNTNATIRGQVLDPSGALVPNARVVIVNKDTGVTVYAGQTDSAGAFVAPQVIPGT
jgi:Carboxypeptidase regulatory-like domain